jgi:hypothetical protein
LEDPVQILAGVPNIEVDLVSAKSSSTEVENVVHDWAIGITLDRDYTLTRRYIKQVTYRLPQQMGDTPIIIDQPPFTLEKTSYSYFDSIHPIEVEIEF